jgi:hypothetical protein
MVVFLQSQYLNIAVPLARRLFLTIVQEAEYVDIYTLQKNVRYTQYNAIIVHHHMATNRSHGSDALGGAFEVGCGGQAMRYVGGTRMYSAGCSK